MDNYKTVGRIEYFDIAKAYLILLVIIGHVLIVMNPNYSKIQYTLVQAFIYTFHMPAFFIIHGVLFHNEKWKQIPVRDFVLKRAYSLIVPYFFFEMVGIIFKFIILKQSLQTGIYNMLTIRCNVGADWFLPALFIGSLLFLIYVKYPNKIYAVVSVIVSFILPMSMCGSQLKIVLGRGLLAYGFIMIGNLAKIFFQSEKNKDAICLFTALAVTGIVSIIGLKFGGNDFYSCVVKNPVAFGIGGISGTYLILGISRLLHSTIISKIGNHTLTIMGTHQLIIYWMTAYFPEIYEGTFVKGLLLLVVILLVEVPVVYLIDLYLLFFVGKRRNAIK